MSFPRGSYPRAFGRFRPSSTRERGPVLAVGWRVVVTCPGDGSDHVTLMDKDGAIALATVPNGIEVEILAWQPFGAGGTRYRVLSARGAVEGWLGAANLKPRQLPPVPKVPRIAAADRVELPVPAARRPSPRTRKSPATGRGR